MRYLRLIGLSNQQYEWEDYRKCPEESKGMRSKIRGYYERTNALIDGYIYMDRLLDSTLSSGPMQYCQAPKPIRENPIESEYGMDEETALLDEGRESGGGRRAATHEQIVKIAIFINLVANAIILISKMTIALPTSSISIIACLVDAALDFLSPAIIWITTHFIERKNQHAYPIGHARIEPLCLLVFSVITITSFLQVGLVAIQRLFSDDHTLLRLTPATIAIMAGAVVIKGVFWLWCRMVKNSSVQALSQDALTNVIFNIVYILFPILGCYLNIWQLDALGGLLLTLCRHLLGANLRRTYCEPNGHSINPG
ncbi:hypothetical protein RUND412_001574 [Rhizina undulata]